MSEVTVTFVCSCCQKTGTRTWPEIPQHRGELAKPPRGWFGFAASKTLAVCSWDCVSRLVHAMDSNSSAQVSIVAVRE